MSECDSFIHACERAVDIKTLNQQLRDFLQSYAVKTFAFTYYAYHPLSSHPLKYNFASKFFTAWHEHYIAEGYEAIDSTLDITYHSTLPILWDLQQQVEAATTARERQMRLDSIEFGAQRGVSIPIHGPNDEFAILLLVQMQGESCLQQWSSIQSDIFNAAHFYFNAIQKLLVKEQQENVEYELSKREMQCLLLVAKRCTVEQMAKQLNITPRTVNFHIQNINKKLGVKNKYLAVQKAIEKQLLVL